MLNPVWLSTFKVLVETGHFTETANKLFMTQPGVSQHIKKLEAKCGHVLMIRHNKQFELTEHGRLVYEYALEQEESEADLLEKLNFDDPYAGICKLACSGSMALRLYPELLKLQVKHPQLIMQLEVSPNQRILDGLESGDFDYGLVTDHPNERVFECETLGSEELCLILPQEASDSDDLLASLKSLGLINHPDAHHYLSLYCAQCGLPNLSALNINRITTSGYVNQLVQILIPVTKGLGFTVLPHSAFNNFEEKDLLTVIKPAKNVRERLVGVKSRHRQLPARYQIVVSKIKSILDSFS
tara:strand:+ start:68585 stop:69481 length:897 start_codon:yes stop_codon:yes gene_type:complete